MAESGQNEDHLHQNPNSLISPTTGSSREFRRVTAEVKRNRKLLIARIVFTALFVTMLLVLTIMKNEQE